MTTVVEGVDIGVPQGTVVAKQFAGMRSQGKAFLFARCAEGMGGADPTFGSNISNGSAAGFLVGPYFVFHPWLDVRAQVAQWFALCGGVGSRSGELPPAIDVELDPPASSPMTKQAIVAALVECVLEVWRVFGRCPAWYSYEFWIQGHFAVATPEQLAVLGSTWLWFASYPGEEHLGTPPAPPAPWTVDRFRFWQRGGGKTYHLPSGGQFAGEPVDDDVFLGELAALEALCAEVAPIPDVLAGVPVPGLVIPGANA